MLGCIAEEYGTQQDPADPTSECDRDPTPNPELHPNVFRREFRTSESVVALPAQITKSSGRAASAGETLTGTGTIQFAP
jgi:hypothetical protein